MIIKLEENLFYCARTKPKNHVYTAGPNPHSIIQQAQALTPSSSRPKPSLHHPAGPSPIPSSSRRPKPSPHRHLTGPNPHSIIIQQAQTLIPSLFYRHPADSNPHSSRQPIYPYPTTYQHMKSFLV